MKLKELYESKERSILTVMGQQPEKVGGDFYCHESSLTSLEGGPVEVVHTYFCYENRLENLIGAPKKIGGTFNCLNNNLTSLEGAPSFIGKTLYCSNNKLTNLKDIHKQIKFIGNAADFSENPIKSHVVGLLLIDGLKRILIHPQKLADILNKHLKANRDVLACIEELEDAGYSEFAKI